MDRGHCSVYGTFCFLFSCTFQGDCSGWFNLENQDVGYLSPFAYRHLVTPRMMRSFFVQVSAQLPPSWIIAEKHRAIFHFLSTCASLNTWITANKQPLDHAPMSRVVMYGKRNQPRKGNAGATTITKKTQRKNRDTARVFERFRWAGSARYQSSIFILRSPRLSTKLMAILIEPKSKVKNIVRW